MEKEICFGNSYRKIHKEHVHIRHTLTHFFKSFKNKKRIYYAKKKKWASPLICLLLQCQTNCRHVASVWSSGSFKQSVCICREVYALPVCVSTLLLAALSACVCLCWRIHACQHVLYLQFQCTINEVPKAFKCTCFCLYWCTFFHLVSSYVMLCLD